MQRDVGSKNGYADALSAAKIRVKLQSAAMRAGDCYLQFRIEYRPLNGRWYVVKSELSF